MTYKKVGNIIEISITNISQLGKEQIEIEIGNIERNLTIYQERLTELNAMLALLD